MQHNNVVWTFSQNSQSLIICFFWDEYFRLGFFPCLLFLPDCPRLGVSSLADCVVRIRDVDIGLKWHAAASALHQPASRHLLCVSGSTLTTIGHSQLLAQWSGTVSQILSGIHQAAQTVLGVYLKRTCSRVTGASSAFGVLNDYALYNSTLTHPLSGRCCSAAAAASVVQWMLWRGWLAVVVV